MQEWLRATADDIAMAVAAAGLLAIGVQGLVKVLNWGLARVARKVEPRSVKPAVKS